MAGGELNPGWKKLLHFVSLWGGERDLLESTKMDFTRLRNESTLWWPRWRFPQRLSIDPTGSWRVGLSDTKHVRRNVQSCIRTCSPAIWQWCGDSPHQTSGFAKVWLSSLAFDTCLASGLMPGAPKVHISTVQRFGLPHLPPWMKNQHGSMRKKP